jgi:Flp pilus assembly protein TadG
MTKQPRRFIPRRGTTTVEFAAVLPVFFLFVFALAQVGHITLLKHLLRHGCRTAARMGATEGVTTSEAIAEAREVLGLVIDSTAVDVQVKDASVYDSDDDLPETDEDFAALSNLELSGAESRQLFLIRAEIQYSDVALLPMPFTQNVTLTGQAIMRHE